MQMGESQNCYPDDLINGKLNSLEQKYCLNFFFFLLLSHRQSNLKKKTQGVSEWENT